MGFLSKLFGGKSSSTQSTTLSPASSEETAYMEMLTETLMPAYLEEMGYEVKQSRSSYQDTEEYKNFQARRQRLLAAREAGTESSELPRRMGGTFQEKQAARDMAQSTGTELIDKQLNALDAEEAKFIREFKPSLQFETRKLETPELEQARAKFGADSDEYRNLKEEQVQNDIEAQRQNDRITQQYMDTTEKFLRGDFSVTKEQKAQVAANLKDVRAAIDEMFYGAKANGGTFQSLNQVTSGLIGQINQTAMSVADALDVVGSQISQTGQDMNTALGETMKVHKQLLDMGIEDLSGELTKAVTRKANAEAVALGRDPSDPEYIKESQDSIAKIVGGEIKRGTLELAEMEAKGKLAITEKIGDQLKDLGMSRAELEAQRGAKLEAAAQSMGGMKIGLEEKSADLRNQIGAGMAPQQIATGMSTQEFNNALAQQRLANAQAGINMNQSVIGTLQRERFATPTTTTTSSSGQGVLGGILGAISGGANIASGIKVSDTYTEYLNRLANAPARDEDAFSETRKRLTAGY